MKRMLTQVVAVAVSGVLTSGCGDLVIKVSKKPRNVEASKITSDKDSASSLKGLEGADDFLNALDDLKGLAIDKVIEELSKGDYRKRFRDGFRYYRADLIKRANRPVTDKNAFYDSDDTCRSTKLNLNIESADQYLGMILQAGLLATISQGSAKALNSKRAQEIAALSQIILKDLGIEVKGDSEVEKTDENTTTTGDFSLKLLSDADDDEQTKAADAAEVLQLKFERVAGEHNIGSFIGEISIGHLVSADSVETIVLNMEVHRERSEKLWVHSAKAKLGVTGKDPYYSHAISFAEIEGEKNKIKITDTLNADLKSEKTITTIFDTDKAEQCKVTLDSNTPKATTDHDTDDTDTPKDDTVLPPPAPDTDLPPGPTVVTQPDKSTGDKPSQTPVQS